MELYGSYTSPFVRHCRIALMQAELPFQFAETAPRNATSPTKRVPYLQDGELALTDSASIVCYIREKAHQPFLPRVQDFDRFCMVNTAADTSVNLFCLANDGVTPESSSYLKRQSKRVDAVLTELNQHAPAGLDMNNDADLRTVCYLDWALFRKLISIEGYDRLQDLMAQARQNSLFAETAPKA